MVNLQLTLFPMSKLKSVLAHSMDIFFSRDRVDVIAIIINLCRENRVSIACLPYTLLAP